MIRELARKLAAFSEFVDFVIIEAKFKRGTFEAGVEILKTHSAMSLVKVSSLDAQLLVKLIRPRKQIKAAVGSRIQSTKKIWRVFTASEVLDFTAEVGDKNKIYKLNPPIVPAPLILENICAEFSANFIKLKFKNFITVGEPLFLQGYRNFFEISSAGVKKVLITME